MKIDIKVVEALARLKSSEPVFIEWLQERLNKHHKDITTMEKEVHVRWSQGRAQELSDLIDNIKGANDIIRKAGR
jgi:hypothetical protein